MQDSDDSSGLLERYRSSRADDVVDENRSTLTKPLVVWDEYPRRGRLVFAACRRSQESGVVPQMPLSHAVELLQQGVNSAGHQSNVNPSSQNLCRRGNDYLLRQRDVTADDHALGRIAMLIQHQITPIVAIESLELKKWAGVSRYQRESLLCDVTGVAHLYGGETGLCHAASSLLARYGIVCRIAVADTVSAAWAFARYGWMNPHVPISITSGTIGEKTRDQLPIESLRIFPDAYKNLKRLGIDRVGQLLTLPRSGLVSRFGKHLILQISRVLGERDEPLPVYCPPSDNRRALVLEYPTRDLPLLQDRVERLVSQVCADLLDIQHGVLRILLRLDLVDHPPRQFEVGLFAPTVDTLQISGLVNQQLEMSRLPGLVQEIQITATLTGPLRMVQNDLFSTSGVESWAEGVSDVELNRFVNALGGRLGKNSVVSVSASKNPLPEKAIQVTSLEGLQKKKMGLRFLDKGKGRDSQAIQIDTTPETQTSNKVVSTGKQDCSTRWLARNELNELVSLGTPAGKGDGEAFAFGIQEPSPDDPMRRPSFLLSKPVRLLIAFSGCEFTEKVQSNLLPNQIQLAGRTYSIIHSWGPERIETGWWKGPSVRRDYYRVELDDGQWWWIFRAFPTAKSRDRRSSWMLHGYFD